MNIFLCENASKVYYNHIRIICKKRKVVDIALNPNKLWKKKHGIFLMNNCLIRIEVLILNLKACMSSNDIVWIYRILAHFLPYHLYVTNLSGNQIRITCHASSAKIWKLEKKSISGTSQELGIQLIFFPAS